VFRSILGIVSQTKHNDGKACRSRDSKYGSVYWTVENGAYTISGTSWGDDLKLGAPPVTEVTLSPTMIAHRTASHGSWCSRMGDLLDLPRASIIQDEFYERVCCPRRREIPAVTPNHRCDLCGWPWWQLHGLQWRNHLPRLGTTNDLPHYMQFGETTNLAFGGPVLSYVYKTQWWTPQLQLSPRVPDYHLRHRNQRREYPYRVYGFGI
jgi:hypothetical protein